MVMMMTMMIVRDLAGLGLSDGLLGRLSARTAGRAFAYVTIGLGLHIMQCAVERKGGSGEMSYELESEMKRNKIKIEG